MGERPGHVVVVRNFRRLIEGRFLRRGRNGRSHGVQQTVVLNLTHHALQVRERGHFDHRIRIVIFPKITDASLRVMNESF